MADSLHTALSQFRDTVLNAVAGLEFKLRDLSKDSPKDSPKDSTTDYITAIDRLHKQNEHLVSSNQYIISSIKSLEENISSLKAIPKKTDSEYSTEILNIMKPVSENIVVTEVDKFANITPDEPELEKFVVDDLEYYKDTDNNVYVKKGDDYEQVGEWDPSENTLGLYDEDEEEDEEVVEDEEDEEVVEAEDEEVVEDEDEEEAVECESFEYKGITYLRDSENNVYNDEGETIGVWTGKKVVLATL